MGLSQGIRVRNISSTGYRTEKNRGVHRRDSEVRNYPPPPPDSDIEKK